MTNKIMTHVVAGYPTRQLCVELLLGMQNSGATMVEIQFPFSDPSADGEIIMKANEVAIGNNITINNCFKMIEVANKNGLKIPVYVMSYANKLFHFGYKRFCHNANKYNVSGILVPDLPFDTSDYIDLQKHTNSYGIELVPVLSPGIQIERVNNYELHKKKLVYISSTKGITGNDLHIQPELLSLIEIVKSKSSCKIALGFGIRSNLHVEQALEVADIAVVGSEVIRNIHNNEIGDAIKLVSKLVYGSKDS